ncbi:MAG: GNAT family N-acetyltransferase [Candidatus Latescibacteria bacterium]|nr:GNAT family N-acetyltransferase [Candidatus Latescibacterota bacterium]
MPEPTISLPDPQPVFTTERLIMRPFSVDDGPRVRDLANDRDIAVFTLELPHPYMEGMAEEWIAEHREQYENGDNIVYAVVLAEPGELVGSVSLKLNRRHERGELGYWIGKDFWGRGYATEACRELIRFGFETVGLNRIGAFHFTRNPASGRVMEKAGMRFEGTLRQAVRKWGCFEDVNLYAVLRADFEREAMRGRGRVGLTE